MNALYKFFRSTKLAIVLILGIALFSILSTLVPQGKEPDFYRKGMQPLVAELVIATGLNNYNRSIPVFFIPLGLFIINLGVCSVDRLVSRARRKDAKRFGPDLIHLSLLILCAGGLITASFRREQQFFMGEGDAVALPGGYTMTLQSFKTLQYDNGRPKAWISTVDVSQDGKIVQKGTEIQVNHPLALGLLNVYQASYDTQGILHLIAPDGTQTLMKTGQSLAQGDKELFFAGMRGDNGLPTAVIEEWMGQTMATSRNEKAGDMVGPYKIASMDVRDVTGLMAVIDPGFIPVLIALILSMVGMTLTVIQKRGEQI